MGMRLLFNKYRFGVQPLIGCTVVFFAFELQATNFSAERCWLAASPLNIFQLETWVAGARVLAMMLAVWSFP